MSALSFQKVTTPAGDWRVLARYQVIREGRSIGRVTRRQDSSKSGGAWSASFGGQVVASGLPTRAAAADALDRYVK